MMVGMGDVHETPGGLNRYFGELRGALRQAGHSVQSVVAAGSDDQQLAGAQRDPGEFFVSAGGSLLTRAGRVRREVLRRLDADAVLNVHFAPYAAPLLFSGRRAQRTVVTFHGPWALEAQVEGAAGATVAMKRIVERLAYRRECHYVTLSDAFATVLAESFGVQRESIYVIRPGVDLERFHPGASAQLTVPTVFCVRRLRRRMGLEQLLDAWRIVADELPEARLVIAGKGPLEAVLRTQIVALGLDDSVRLAGFLDDGQLVEHFQSAHLTVVPTVALEGFGLVVLESLACGVAPIVTNIAGLPEVPAELCGELIVAADDPRALATRLLEGLTGARWLPDRGQCRSFAERFSWAAAAESYAHLFTSVREGAQ